jgi:glutaredoxin
MTDILHITCYGTAHCHLCEQAEQMLQQLAQQFACLIDTVDISSDDALLEAYQTSIPVVYFADFQQTLAWPFSYHDLLHVVRQHRL